MDEIESITYRKAQIFMDKNNHKVPFHVGIAETIGRKVVNGTYYYFKSMSEAKSFIDENQDDLFF